MFCRLGVAAVWSCLLLLGCVARAEAATPSLVSVGSFTKPTYVTAPAGDTHRVFVVERAGVVQVLDDGVQHQFLDISSLVACCEGERGMLSLAFAPDYATSGLFYVFYTAVDPRGQVTVAEYRRSSTDPDAADPASARVVLTIPHDGQSNHNGGQLQFGPDGYLYIGVGDGGGGGDPAKNGQNLTSSDPPSVPYGTGYVNHNPLLGKLLRIDPRSGSPYGIPTGNPFPAPAQEVFAYGLRNPWRFSFDRETGDLAIGDVGQDAFEEIDEAPAPGRGLGANYGWSLFEGLHTYPLGLPAGPPFPDGFVFPVLEKSHSGNGSCSITGGYVVRDPALPELDGQYVYSDFCNAGLRAVTLSPGSAIGDQSLGLNVPSIDSFGEDGCGRVYAVSLSGPVYRLATTGDCAGPSIPFAKPAVSVGDATLSEGDSGTTDATFKVSLSSTTTSAVTVDYTTTDGTATAPGDYTSSSGTLTFAPGETSKTITVAVAGDTTYEPDETFTVDLSNPTNATIAGGSGVGTILNDDPAPAVSIGDATLSEGDSGTTDATFAVSLSGATASAATVDYTTTDGTATAPDDYTSTSGTLTFAPGEISKTITVAITGDTIYEPDETFTVDLSNATNATIADGSGVGTILNDDPVPSTSGPVGISVTNKVRVDEGNSGTTPVTFAVTLSAPSDQPVAVDYATADRSATAPSDYTATSGRLVFAPGTTSATVTVQVVGDTRCERNETFVLQLSNPTANARIAHRRGTAEIDNDDLVC